MIKKIFSIILVCFVVLGGYLYFDRPKISVVMATHNRSQFLDRSIQSILDQTFKDFEFIIVNDGSLDNTDKILEKYTKRDKRIKVITNEENKGLVYSLNKGIDEAKGKYIARMDDDDVSLPTRFEKQYAFMEKNKDFAVVGSWISNPENNAKWPVHDETDSEKIKVLLYLNSVPISHPASFLRRSFLNKHNIRYKDAYKAAEDRKFWLDILDAGGKITNIPEVLLKFRIHTSNPASYYYFQSVNSHKFFYKEIALRFMDEKEAENAPRCIVIKKMVAKNKELNLVSQSVLKSLVNESCGSEKFEKVEHSKWTDYFVFKEEKVCRFEMKDCAHILQQTETLLVIKWDHWGEETFEKKEGIWYLKQ